MIYYDIDGSKKEEKISEVVSLLNEVKEWASKNREFILGIIGVLAIIGAVVLLVDDSTVVGILDDPAAIQLFASGFTLLTNSFCSE